MVEIDTTTSDNKSDDDAFIFERLVCVWTLFWKLGVLTLFGSARTITKGKRVAPVVVKKPSFCRRRRRRRRRCPGPGSSSENPCRSLPFFESSPFFLSCGAGDRRTTNKRQGQEETQRHASFVRWTLACVLVCVSFWRAWSFGVGVSNHLTRQPEKPRTKGGSDFWHSGKQQQRRHRIRRLDKCTNATSPIFPAAF